MTNAFVNGFFDECKSLATMTKEAQAAPAAGNKWLVPLIASGIGAVGGGLMAGKKKRLQGMLMGALGGAAAGWGGKKIYDQGNQIKGLKGDVASRDKTITGLQDDVASRDSTIRQQGNQITGMESQLKDRQQQIEDMGRAIAGHEATIGDLKGNVENLTGQLGDRDKQILGLQGNVNDLTGQLGERDKQILGLTGDVGHRDQQIKDLTGQVTGLNKTLDDRATEIAGLNSQLAENAARIAQLDEIAGWKAPARTYLDSLVADRKNLEDRNAALQGYLNTVDATGEGVAARDQELGDFVERLLGADAMLSGKNLAPALQLTPDELRQTADQLVSLKSSYPAGSRGENLAENMKLTADVMDGIADQDALIEKLKADIEAEGGTANTEELARRLAQLQNMVKQVQTQMAQQKKQQATELAKSRKALQEAEKRRKGMKLPTPYARPGR